MTEIEIRVGLKLGMADPEGANVQKALGLLGFDSAKGVKSARCYRVSLNLPEAEALEEAERMCRRLLANPVVHDYSISVVE